MGLLIIFLVSFIASISGSCTNDKNLVLDLAFKLSGNDVVFPCPTTKNIYASSGRWIPKNIIATRLAVYNDYGIVTLSRFRQGVPFTVGRFPLVNITSRVPLVAFPCWSIQEEGSCDSIQNAIDLTIDPLDILWVLDLGICNTLEQPVKRCSPKLWGIKPDSGKVVKTIDLSTFLSFDSRIQYLVVDYSVDGVPYAYISDAGSASIIVINILHGTGFRVVLPVAICPSVKDIFYLQLIRKSHDTVLYFSYLSSPFIYSIKTKLLQQGHVDGAIIKCGTKPLGYQVVLLGTDNGAGIFFRYKGDSDIYVWNTDTAFKPENFLLVHKGGYCRMATQVIPGWKKLMWAIESNFHDYITGTTGCLGPSIIVYPLVKTSES